MSRDPSTEVRTALRVRGGIQAPDGLAAHDPRERPVGPRSKSAAAEQLVDLAAQLDARQEALYAEGTRSVLLVLQGMDTSGKGGVIRYVAGLVNPQGLTIDSFKKPTAPERAHHFLWRVRPRVPAAGQIGVFDRSHYEDVLIARVEALVPEDVWSGRYAEIVAFEAELTARGVAVVKCMLHLSPAEQAERLLARLDDPAKRWKYNPGDVDARRKWPAYQQAYADALRHTDTDTAPWFVVPADRKWYRNWAIASIVLETLIELDPRFPPSDVDVGAERARIAASVVA